MPVKHFAEPAVAPGRYSPGECISTEQRRVEDRPDPAHVSTSYVEWSNFSIRMGNRRFTRLTNTFSKNAANHAHALPIDFMHYNFVRIHQTPRYIPANGGGRDYEALGACRFG